MRVLLTLAACLLPALVQAETGIEMLRKIRRIRFAPEQCYKVRDLFLEREDAKLHFSDGYLLFAEPVEGRSLAAVFLAATDTGEGEVIVMPPMRSERQSLSRFAGAPVLQEHIRTALMFFSDDTAERLRAAMAENPYNQPDAEAGRALAENWTPVARNVITGYETRMLIDALSPVGPAAGFFAAAISGARLGRFDLLIDPRRLEQVTIGQVVWQEGARYYDVWASFPARSIREKRRQPLVDSVRLDNYRIEANLSAELDMRVTARASLVAGRLRERGIAFELSRQMKVSKVLLDGRPVEYLQNEPLDSSELRLRGNDWLVVALEAALDPGSRHEMEFEYAGDVITEVGRGIYSVGARGNWYPSRGFGFSDFDLLFRHPKRLELVATGRPIESSLDGEFRVTRWKPDGPIRVAGFNLGDFERTSVRAGDFTVEVCAHKHLEPATPPFPLTPIPETLFPPRRLPPRLGPGVSLAPPEPPPATPASRIEQVARDTAEALEFFAARFGPPPIRHLTISPVPGRFGLGFPGLVYISTLSYYQPGDKPLERLSPGARTFFSEQLRAHEIAHQWWGNLVTSTTYHDDWLMESLADYSALLYLEHRKGPRALEEALGRYRDNLLAKQESGETVESAGAIVLGERLRSSKTPRAQRTIVYEKGAWVMHMLRRLMGDAKFFRLLAELRKRYEYKTINTEEFRALAAELLPSVPQDPALENFFYQWVYSTGIPSLAMDYKIAGKAPRLRVEGVVRQAGVPEDFSIPAPVEIQFAGRRPKIETQVQTANGETAFSVPLPLRPSRVLLDPRDSVLAAK